MRLRANLPKRPTPPARRGGYVIFAVLIVVVVLSLVAYRFTESMTAEYRANVRATDGAQAKLAAVSGLHYSAAILSHRQTFYGELGGNPYQNPAIFEQFEVAAGPGRKPAAFSIRTHARTDDGGYEERFGVVDEGGKLNINAMFSLSAERKDRQGNVVVPEGKFLYDALMKLPYMTAEIANAIIDWLDANDDPRDGNGAESDHYTGLDNPYRAKNGPLNSLDEMLLIRGVTPELLYGGDRNRNGVLDPGETGTDRGWSDFITVYGRELNTDMWGNTRVYLNDKTNNEDLDVTWQQLEAAGIDPDLSAYIIACKVLPDRVTYLDDAGTPTRGFGVGQTQAVAPGTAAADDAEAAIEAKRNPDTGKLVSARNVRLDQLLNSRITFAPPKGSPPDSPPLVMDSPLLSTTGREKLLPVLMDKTTTTSSVERVPRINVNTAPREVLEGVPNMTPEMVDAILAERANQDPTTPAYTTAAWLVTSGVVTPSQFRGFERYLTGSTMVFRVQSIGYLPGGGPVARLEAVIDVGPADPANNSIGAPRFLYVRDLADLDSPRGYDPAAQGNQP